MKALALAAALLLSSGVPAEASAWHGPIRLTWYGADYFGNRTACGQKYTRRTVGVATWLPLRCGTLIELRWRKRRIVVPVIDRMPQNNVGPLDASAHIACELLNGPRLQGVCFSRSDVYWRVIR